MSLSCTSCFSIPNATLPLWLLPCSLNNFHCCFIFFLEHSWHQCHTCLLKTPVVSLHSLPVVKRLQSPWHQWLISWINVTCHHLIHLLWLSFFSNGHFKLIKWCTSFCSTYSILIHIGSSLLAIMWKIKLLRWSRVLKIPCTCHANHGLSSF